MAALGDLLIRVGANIDGFEKAMGDVSKRLNAVDREAQRAFSGFAKIGQRLSDIGGSLSLGLTAPLAGLAAASVVAFGTLDSLERGLNTVTGSAAKTAVQLAELREVAKLPGLGLQEAVQGSINLQTLGFSADKSKAILLQFGNAIASVGRGKEDLAEVIRQLGQLGARGVVTADNLKPIIERVPQVAKIIKDSFGPEALGNPAETFRKLGVSSEDLINKLITELSKLPRVTGGIKNDFENLKDTITVSLGKIGASIAPFVSQAINVLVPAMEKMVNLFVGLPKPMQDAIIVFAGLAAAIGPILLVSGSLISAFASIASAVTGLSGVIIGLATTALPVVTAAFTAFGTVAIPAAIAALRTMATTTLPNVILQVGLLSELMLRQAITSFTTFATVTIPAAIAALVRFAVTAIPAAIAGLTTFATTSIPSAIASLTTFTVTTIPAATAALIRFATAGIGAAITGIASFATAAAPFVIAALSTMAVAALAAAAAFAGFKLGEWAYNNIPGVKALGDAIAWLILHVPGATAAFNAYAGVGSATEQANTKMAAAVQSLTAKLAAQGIVIEHGSMTLDQFLVALRNASMGVGTLATAIDASATKATAAKKAHEALKNELETQEKVLSELKKAYELGAVGADALVKQEEKLYNIMRQLHPEWESTRKYSQDLVQSLSLSADGFKELGDSAFKAQFQVKTWAETLGITNEQIGIFARSYPKLISSIEKESKELTKAITGSFGKLGEVGEIVKDSQRQILGDMRDLSNQMEREDPFRRLGIASQDSLRNLAAKARSAYEQIKSDTRSTTLDIQRAWVAMISAQIRAGEQLPKETLNQYEKVKAATGDTVRAVDSAWSQMSKQISTVVTDLSRGIADAIVNFKSLGDVGLTVIKNIATAILRTLIEGAIHKLANELAGLPGIIGAIGKAFGGVADHVKSATSAVTDLSKVITGAGGALGTTVGAAGGIPKIGGPIGNADDGDGLPGIPSVPGIPKIPGVGSAGTSAAGSSLTGIIGAVGSVVSAISGVISNFQLARQEGTLNAIEQHTKVMAIGLVGISAPWEKVADGQDTLFEKMGQIRNAVVEKLPWIVDFAHISASALKDYIQPNTAMMVESLKAIEQQLMSAPQVQQAVGTKTASNITINVNGANDPAAVAKAVMDLLKSQSPVFV